LETTSLVRVQLVVGSMMRELVCDDSVDLSDVEFIVAFVMRYGRSGVSNKSACKSAVKAKRHDERASTSQTTNKANIVTTHGQ
jgi:hypothetical protein